MMILHSADLKTLNMNLPELLRKRGALLTAGNQSGCNTMTIGWAQSGMVWGKPVCTVYVRPERYTYQFMEAQDYFTLSFLPESEKQTMAFCGSRSGRDTDKIAACGLAVEYGAGDAPYFAQAELVLVCRKLYVQNLDLGPVTDEAVLSFYGPAKGGIHRAYTGEIVEAYTFS